MWTPVDDNADSYVVKYIHEPSAQVSQPGQRHTDLWQERSIPDKNTRHVEITGLITDKPYAFCVLAVREGVSTL
jgi:hypothetical protein